jgi:formylglycine-generating enzyme required for sulfatase activity
LVSVAQRDSAILLLLGTSGSGKSSIIRAGLVPQLEAEADNRWLVLGPFSPGLDPFAALERVLLGHIPKEAAQSIFRREPSAPNKTIMTEKIRWLQSRTKSTILLVIDQFEELLDDQSNKECLFLELLEEVIRSSASGLAILAAMRTDCLDILQSHSPTLAGMAATHILQPIRKEDFSLLISGPAQLSGLTLQPGLQERLVEDSTSVPLLAFTLEKLWQLSRRRSRNTAQYQFSEWDLTISDYEALGGVAGAIESQARLCWNPLTSNKEETIAIRDAFLHHLVRLREDGLIVKQQARWSDLPPRSIPILRKLVDARLLVVGTSFEQPKQDHNAKIADAIEVAHEALLAVWQPLVRWLEEGKYELEQRRRILTLCNDLQFTVPAIARKAALHSLLILGGEEALNAMHVIETLSNILCREEYEQEERMDAIRILGHIGGKDAIAKLSFFLEKNQLKEFVECKYTAPHLDALCLAATSIKKALASFHPVSERQGLQLLTSSAAITSDGKRLSTKLVSLEILDTPTFKPNSAWQEDLGEGIALTMISIPSGSFIMGTSDEDDDSFPRHTVTIKDPFWIGQTPITRAQWREVMGPERFKDDSKIVRADNEPITGISWNDAIDFCNRLGSKTGRNYTLASESQWEYACRAGTDTLFSCGDALVSEAANYNEVFVTEVDQYPSNAWGINDMHGNVREWCLDFYHESYISAPNDGGAWLSCADEEWSEKRVVRGGSFRSESPINCTSAYRWSEPIDNCDDHLGFRVVCMQGGHIPRKMSLILCSDTIDDPDAFWNRNKEARRALKTALKSRSAQIAFGIYNPDLDN